MPISFQEPGSAGEGLMISRNHAIYIIFSFSDHYDHIGLINILIIFVVPML